MENPSSLPPAPPSITPHLYRSTSNRVLGGVAAGLAEYVAIDPVFIRLLFVILALINGVGLLAYMVLWVCIPSQDKGPYKQGTLKDNAQDISQTVQRTAQTWDSPANPVRPWAAWILIAIGICLLLVTTGLAAYFFSFAGHIGNYIWPIILIVIGLIIIVRK